MHPIERHIHNNDKVFFLHIPKTAGTSMAAIIEQNFQQEEIAPFLVGSSKWRGIPSPIINEYRYFSGHVSYDFIVRQLGETPICLTMLREPIERYISTFANLQRAPVPSNALDFHLATQEREYLRRITLSEFVNNSEPILADLTVRFQNRQTTQIAAKINVKKQGPYLYEVNRVVPSTVLLKRAKKRLEEFTFIGLTERFQYSLFLLAYTFGWSPVVDYQHLNVAPSRPRQDELDSKTLERLCELNALDLDLYTHAQELFQVRFDQMTHELLEHYGERWHAHLDPPLSNEVMVELLEKHYERRFSERQQPVKSVDFNFEQIMPGSGWHYPEEHPEYGIYRWTGPGSCSTLHFLFESNPGDMQIEFTVLAAITVNMIETLSLVANDYPIPLEKTADKNGQVICKGYLPGTMLAKTNSFIRLVFLIDSPAAPSTLDPNSPDNRLLGVAINRLTIKPVESKELNFP